MAQHLVGPRVVHTVRNCLSLGVGSAASGDAFAKLRRVAAFSMDPPELYGLRCRPQITAFSEEITSSCHLLENGPISKQ